jgi:hypothetical protein
VCSSPLPPYIEGAVRSTAPVDGLEVRYKLVTSPDQDFPSVPVWTIGKTSDIPVAGP